MVDRWTERRGHAARWRLIKRFCMAVWLCLAAALVGPMAASAQPAAPYRATFYYPWYPETWAIDGNPVKYTPALRYYNSDDRFVVDRHIHWMGYAKFEVAIASWFGPGTHEERFRIPRLLNRTEALGSELKWALYYEKEGYANPPTAEIRRDLDYASRYTSHPSFMRIRGKPVIFVYNADDGDCNPMNRWAPFFARYYVVMKVFGSGEWRGCAHQPASWHQYGPSTREHEHLPYSYAISPGFNKANQSSARLMRDLDDFRRAIRHQLASRATWQLVTTFNEWGEGTAIEPAKAWLSDRDCEPRKAACPGRYLTALASNEQESGRRVAASAFP
jgi:hypothetical protein